MFLLPENLIAIIPVYYIRGFKLEWRCWIHFGWDYPFDTGMQQTRGGNHRFHGIGSVLIGNMTVGDSWIRSCKCEAESISGATTKDENGTWFVDSAKKFSTINKW
ncbi:hypothetical protein ACFXTI_040212 [Malus domestica]